MSWWLNDWFSRIAVRKLRSIHSSQGHCNAQNPFLITRYDWAGEYGLNNETIPCMYQTRDCKRNFCIGNDVVNNSCYRYSWLNHKWFSSRVGHFISSYHRFTFICIILLSSITLLCLYIAMVIKIKRLHLFSIGRTLPLWTMIWLPDFWIVQLPS